MATTLQRISLFLTVGLILHTGLSFHYSANPGNYTQWNWNLSRTAICALCSQTKLRGLLIRAKKKSLTYQRWSNTLKNPHFSLTASSFQAKMKMVSIKRAFGFGSQRIQSDSLEIEAQICAKWGQAKRRWHRHGCKMNGLHDSGLPCQDTSQSFLHALIFSPELAISSVPLWERWNLFYSNFWTVLQTSKLILYDLYQHYINGNSFIYLFWEISQIYQWRVVDFVRGEIIGQPERATTLQINFPLFSQLASFFIMG